MNSFPLSFIVPASLTGQVAAKRRASSSGEFGALLAADQPVGANTQPETATGVESLGLLAVSARPEDRPRSPRSSRAVIDDALALVKRLQVLLMDGGGSRLDPAELERLASELEAVADTSGACRGIALRLRIEREKLPS